MTVILLPISALIPTRNRALPLQRTLESLAQQEYQPMEMVVVDASDGDETQQLCHTSVADLVTKIYYYRAIAKGAAIQRNQAIEVANQPFIWLIDDDILLEKDCLKKVWQALESSSEMGGVNAMITNQKYSPPGEISRALFRFLHGQDESSFAGKCIGPALNLLPEDREDLPEIVPVEWLNTTCVLYRREALPTPLFPTHFKGYSLMEDVTLSLMVGKKWKLANARTARIFHDSQPGDHKKSAKVLAQMDLVNRHFVMTHILKRDSLQDYWKLTVLQLFAIASLFGKEGRIQDFPAVVFGKILGIMEILRTRTQLSSENV